MPTPAKITASLRRLCLLESGQGPLCRALTEWERKFEIARLRGILPAAILAHHDRMLHRTNTSIAAVRNGICSSCGQRLPAEHAARLQSSQDLEVCDHCGLFLYIPESESTARVCQ
jgi:predicted  nucleic acid-binding Zn-ribbon protein